MKLRNYRLERSPKLMIIPMIDIIFFLLVFFMMSTLYMVEQHAMPISLPQAAASGLNVEKAVTVSIMETGHIYVEEEAMPLELLQRRMQAELARNQHMGVILRADRRVEHGLVVAVLDELKAAGIQRVSVATDGNQR